MSLTRRDGLALVGAHWCGLCLWVAGCNHKDKRRAHPYTTPGEGGDGPTHASPPPEPLPPPPTEGRLVTGEWASRGNGTRIEEPLAPAGRWVARGGFWLWLPDGWESVLDAVGYELSTALPRWEPDGPALDPRPGPAWHTRIVLIPGPTFGMPGVGPVAGYLGRALWPDGSDVLWLGLTDQDTRGMASTLSALTADARGNPVTFTYARYCPAAEHELAHQWSGQDRHPWDGGPP